MATDQHPALSVLVVEDDPGVAALLRRSLGFEGYRVHHVETGPAAIEAVSNSGPDLMVLDVMIPGIDGIEVSRRIREAERLNGRSPIPILMLTARDTVSDRVKGLDSGADDYLVKPFALDEFLARIRALRRRLPVTDEAPRDRPITFNDVSMDVPARVVHRGDRQLRLTPREFDLLAFFLKNPNIVLTRNQIMDRVWGADFWGDSNVLEVFVGNLRKELESSGEPRLIQTVRGVGYVLRLAPDH
jgi:two-component system response regulator MprA